MSLTTEFTALVSSHCRVRRIYSGGCLPVVDLPVLRSYGGQFKDKVRTFVSDYCSHLASGNEKGVDRIRAERLEVFLCSKLQ
jgi:hypothetical protein